MTAELRKRHPLTHAEEHAHLVAGSRLFNRRLFYETHEEWEEVWRRAWGSRRELLRGLIQIAVGYEHAKRGNAYGARSLLMQGARRLRPHRRRPGVAILADRALSDRDRPGPAPKVMLRLRGFADPRAPRGAIEIEVPRSRKRPGAARS